MEEFEKTILKEEKGQSQEDPIYGIDNETREGNIWSWNNEMEEIALITTRSERIFSEESKVRETPNTITCDKQQTIESLVVRLQEQEQQIMMLHQRNTEICQEMDVLLKRNTEIRRLLEDLQGTGDRTPATSKEQFGKLNLKRGKNKMKDSQMFQGKETSTTKEPEVVRKCKDRKKGVSIRERRSKPYSFRKDKTFEVFNLAMQHDLQLPKCKRPEEEHQHGEPNFCPYHRILGHTIENCYIFKDWVEDELMKGELYLPKHILQCPAPHK